MEQVRAAVVLSLSNKHAITLQNPTNRKAERILIIPTRTESWGAGVKQVRSAGVLSLSNKQMIILQNPTNRKAERILVTLVRTEGWCDRSETGGGGWNSVPFQ
jgi:hypothetical protein